MQRQFYTLCGAKDWRRGTQPTTLSEQDPRKLLQTQTDTLVGVSPQDVYLEMYSTAADHNTGEKVTHALLKKKDIIKKGGCLREQSFVELHCWGGEQVEVEPSTT